MPFHVAQDGLEEERLSKTGAQFGSTKRGIAYTYGDKYMKKTLRMGDLLYTGTPVGVGPVHAGDTLRATLEGETLLDFDIR